MSPRLQSQDCEIEALELIVKYEAEADELRTAFEQFGDIKTYFDLVKQRGMIFITYVSPFSGEANLLV